MAPNNPYIKYSAALFLALFIITSSLAQLKQTPGFEKEREFLDQDFIIIPLNTEGIALVREKNKYKGNKKLWEVILLDSTLKEKSNLTLEIDLRSELSGYEYAPGLLHLLFTRKETRGVMNLVSLDLTGDEPQYKEIKPELSFVLTQFCKVGDRFAFGGYVNLEPAVLLYTPATNNIKVVPGFFTKNSELMDMRANKNQTFNTLVLENGDKSIRKITFRTFDSSGKQLFDYFVNIDDEITLQNGICSTLELDDLVLIGTWGKRNSKQAMGYYSIAVNPFGEKKINRTFFGELDHYLDYLKPKKISKVKLTTSKAKEKGKFPDFTNYVMPYKIIERKKQFLMLSESYVPSRSDQNHFSPVTYNTATSPSPYGGYYRSNNIYNPYYPSGQNVTLEEDGKTVHGALVAFDPTGKVLWDYSIKLEEIKKLIIQQTVDVYLSDQEVQLLYKKESDIKVKTIDLASGETTDFTEKIQTKLGDEIRSEDKELGEIRNWYGNTFFVWGNHTLRNRANGGKTREVFYINKVVVH